MRRSPREEMTEIQQAFRQLAIKYETGQIGLESLKSKIEKLTRKEDEVFERMLREARRDKIACSFDVTSRKGRERRRDR